MKILFFSHYFPPEGNAPAARTSQMCRRWARTGHEVTVVTCVPNVPNGIPYPGYRNRLVQREVIDGIRTVRVWTYLAPNKGTVRRIINYVTYMFSSIVAGLFAPRPDVVVATSPQFFCGWAGAVVSRLRRRPFVLEIRDLWPESIETVGALRGRRLLRVLGWLEQKLYASAAHIVAVGEGYRDRLVERGVPASKVSVVTNGVDAETFFPRPPDEELKERYGLTGSFVCSYIGTIGMACGLDVVLRAARMLKFRHRDDVRFLLVGDGAVRSDLEQQAAKQGLDNVVFTGLQPKERIPAFLSVTDACLVHLRKRELFRSVLPSKIFEAAAMMKPIILGVEGSSAQLINEAGAGLCMEPENEAQLVDAVERLASDRARCASLGQAARDNVAGRFNLDQLAESYLGILSRTTGGPCSATPPRA